MNKYLVIYAHPTHDGHHGYFLKTLTEKLQAQKADLEIIDLYDLKYDPILSATELYATGEERKVDAQNKIFQDKISAANRLVFIYPTWWQNMPAILKGFVDRVFVSGFGFVYHNGLPVGLLKNKKAAIFSATGGPRWFTRFLTGDFATKTLAKYVLKFCGMSTKGFSIGSARTMNDKSRLEMAKMANKMLTYLA